MPSGLSTLCENEFTLDSNTLYLNHAAVSPWPRRTYTAVEKFAHQCSTFGARFYPDWLKTETTLRHQLAALIQASSADDIALLKNTSEGLSVIAHGLSWQPGDHVVITNQEFPSNRIPWESLRSRGVEVRYANLDDPDLSPEEALVDCITPATRLVSVSSVQYGTGLKMDMNYIGKICQERDILLCVDAIQSLGALPFSIETTHADFVVADGHKWMLGPEGLALFYSSPKAREKLTLHQYGWHMIEHPGDYDRQTWEVARSARRFECGSPNMLCAHALSASLSLLLEAGLEDIEAAIEQRILHLQSHLKHIEGIHPITPQHANRRAGIYTFDTGNNPQVFRQLQAEGVVCALRGGGIRFSPHFYTPFPVIDRAVKILENIMLKLN